MITPDNPQLNNEKNNETINETNRIRLIFASDHAGFLYKEQLKDFIENHDNAQELVFVAGDTGTYSEDSVDYPDFIHSAVRLRDKMVLERPNETVYCVFICGSGNGVSMTANKYPTVRAGLCWEPEIAQMARAHNNANALSIPARYVSVVDARKILLTFLETEFEGGRHQRRVGKIAIPNVTI